MIQNIIEIHKKYNKLKLTWTLNIIKYTSNQHRTVCQYSKLGNT
jgi:hypothetical protein